LNDDAIQVATVGDLLQARTHISNQLSSVLGARRVQMQVGAANDNQLDDQWCGGVVGHHSASAASASASSDNPIAFDVVSVSEVLPCNGWFVPSELQKIGANQLIQWEPAELNRSGFGHIFIGALNLLRSADRKGHAVRVHIEQRRTQYKSQRPSGNIWGDIFQQPFRVAFVEKALPITARVNTTFDTSWHPGGGHGGTFLDARKLAEARRIVDRYVAARLLYLVMESCGGDGCFVSLFII
jgi:hypothetical protein